MNKKLYHQNIIRRLFMRRSIPPDIVSLQCKKNAEWKTLIGPDSTFSATGPLVDDLGNPTTNPVQSRGLAAMGAWTNFMPVGSDNLSTWVKNGPCATTADTLTVNGTDGYVYITTASLPIGTYTISCMVDVIAGNGLECLIRHSVATYVQLSGGALGSGQRIVTVTTNSVAPIAFFFGTHSSADPGDIVKGTQFQITQSAYKYPYCPPGITVPATSATTGGNGTNTAMVDKMLAALRGETDGVELWAGGDFTSSIGSNSMYGYDPVFAWDSFSGGVLKFTRETTSSNWEGLVRSVLTSGIRYKISLDVYNVNVSGNLTAGASIAVTSIKPSTTGVWERKTIEVIASGSDIAFYSESGTAGQIWYIDNISIQRLLPSVFTACALVYVGAGSGELPIDTNHNVVTANSSPFYMLYQEYRANDTKSLATSFDGTTFTGFDDAPWNRDEIHLKVVQTNPINVPNVGDFAGKYFRTSNMRFTSTMVPIDADIVDGPWALYDGSMNPLTHLRLALNGVIPLWFLMTLLSNKSMSKAEIKRSLRYPR